MDDLKLIKKHYGEKMMHLCREMFPTLLETEGLLFTTLSKKFAYSRCLYDDIEKTRCEDIFKSIIYAEIDVKRDEERVNKTPHELLDEAGYTLYECKTEKDIQAFKKYYAPNEALCTFNGGRLDYCHVFFAVKKNVDEIKREDFISPQREDEYGTSVISIQFSKGEINTLSIKNRYNHRVSNPDATFSNNLENIIPGLTKSFEKEYGYNINSNVVRTILPGYVLANDGKYYKYNFERANIYYCPNNIIIDNSHPKQYDQSRYILFENYILDMQEKTIKRVTGAGYPLVNYTKIEIKKDKKNNNKQINLDDTIVFVLNKDNRIIHFKDTASFAVNRNFLETAELLETLDMPKLRFIDNYFLSRNEKLTKINIPLCQEIGFGFLSSNTELEAIDLPNVRIIDHLFLTNNEKLTKINIPRLEQIGNSFLSSAPIEELDLPNVRRIGDSFLYLNKSLKKIHLPVVEEIRDAFLSTNKTLEEISLPLCTHIGKGFLTDNDKLKYVHLPSLRIVRGDFLRWGESIEEIDLPNLEQIDGMYFMQRASKLRKINLPKLEDTGYYFLSNPNNIKEISLPSLIFADRCFMYGSQIEKIEVPRLEKIEAGFLGGNNKLKELDLPSCKFIGCDFLEDNKKLKRLSIPVCEGIRKGALDKNKSLIDIEYPESLEEKLDSFDFFRRYKSKRKVKTKIKK